MPQERLDRQRTVSAISRSDTQKYVPPMRMRFDLNQRRAPPAVVFRGALHVANWFYLAFIVTIAVLNVADNPAIPISMFSSKSYIVWSGVQDAMIEWWSRHITRSAFSSRRLPRPDDVAGTQ